MFNYKRIIALVAALVYIFIFYYKIPLELFIKTQVSKLLHLEDTALWRVKFISGRILDLTAIALLQLIIYNAVADKKYSRFCILVFLVLYFAGILLLLSTVFYQILFINKLAYLLLNLVTDPFLTLVLLGAYPIFRFDNTKVSNR